MFVFPLFMFFIAFLYFCFIFAENFEQTKKKTMKNNTPFIDWKKVFDKEEEKSKIGYDYLLSENIEILTNNFEAYRTDYSIDILIESGEIVFLLNGVKRIVNSLSFVIVQAGDELHFISFSDDVKLCFNIISPEIRYSLLEKFEENSIFQQINALNSVFSLEESNFDIYQNNISEVKSLLSNKDNTNKLQQLTHLLICHHYKLAHKHHPSISNNDSILFNSFLSLLSENFIEERNSSFYAEKLCKSKVQFDFIIKRDTGKTPTMWIEEKLANEIKKDLNDTSVYISQISEKYKFSSVSSFSKFFSRVTGITPSNYRKENSNR